MTALKRKTSAADAIVLLSTIALMSFVIAMLHFAQDILIPLALAALLTFLLAPLVTRIERWVGRVVAVLAVVTMIFAGTGVVGWVITQQAIDLATKLPDYKENIVKKLRTFHLPEGGMVAELSKTVEELKKELPGRTEEEEDEPAATVIQEPGEPKAAVIPTPAPRTSEVPRERVKSPEDDPMKLIRSMSAPLLGPLGTAAIVLVLVIFMLLQREDLRNRLIRLIGQGRISATTNAMDDAGQRVTRYLLMQLVVNVTYGIPVAIGLYFIGVPNAILWGGLATVLRFIPYVGPWIAASFPVALSLAVSPGWVMPLLTIGLFVVLEVLSNNVMEPWLYGSSTGVSPLALIVAAIVWTWLWGPVGLVLATPLTVCLVVMGRHVSRLSFFCILLSDEKALTPAEDFYHRLLTSREQDEINFVESYLKAHSSTSLYDAVFIPVISTAAIDAREETLDGGQLRRIEQDLRDFIEDLGTRPPVSAKTDDDRDESDSTEASATPMAMPACRVACLPARAERDELAGAMLAQLLRNEGAQAWSAPGVLASAELLGLLGKSAVDVVCISVVAPSTVIHARHLCLKVRTHYPEVKIVIGLWGATEGVAEVAKRLRDSGANEVVLSLADAIVQIAKLAPQTPAPSPDSDAERLLSL